MRIWRAIALIAVAAVLAGAACTRKAHTIAVPAAVSATEKAASYRFAGDVTRRLDSTAKPETSHLSGRYEAPDRTEVTTGRGADRQTQFFIGSDWYSPAGASGYNCMRGQSASAPTIATALLTQVAAASRVTGTASKFSFTHAGTGGALSGTVTTAGGVVRTITFRAAHKGGAYETGRLTYSDVGSAGHITAPAADCAAGVGPG
jgi:hypothetical protein